MEEKDLGVIVNRNFKVSKQSLVKPHLKYCIQAWRPHLVKDIELWEKVQKRAMRMTEECAGKTYEERLKIVGLTTLACSRFNRNI